MSMPSYAAEVFPWANIDGSLTVSGLIEHRRTHRRREWGRVLNGTTKELADVLNRFVIYQMSDTEMQKAFCSYLVAMGLFEDFAVGGIMLPKHPVYSAFVAGWKAHDVP